MSVCSVIAPTSSLRRTTIAVAAVGAAATTVAAVAMRAVGVHLAAHGRIPPGAFAQLTFAGGLLGGGCSSPFSIGLPRRRFIQIVVALAALSCLAPAVGGDDVASKTGLTAIHLLAATIIAPVLARQTTR